MPKYFKRIGSKGHYKYFYNKEQWDKHNKKSESNKKEFEPARIRQREGTNGKKYWVVEVKSNATGKWIPQGQWSSKKDAEKDLKENWMPQEKFNPLKVISENTKEVKDQKTYNPIKSKEKEIVSYLNMLKKEKIIDESDVKRYKSEMKKLHSKKLSEDEHFEALGQLDGRIFSNYGKK